MGAIRTYWDNIIEAVKSNGSPVALTGTDNGDLNINVNTLLSGEDQDHGVFKTENQFGYVVTTLSVSADVDIANITAGIGDLLVAVYFNTDIGEDIIIKDGVVPVFTISSPLAGETWHAPGGGVLSTSKWIVSQTTSATDNIVCVGTYG
jgi:hypothetical protein